MFSLKTIAGVLVVLFALAASAVPAAAQITSTVSSSTYTVSLAGGIGGSVDESESGYDNSVVQLGFSVVTRRAARIAVRLGRLGEIERAGNIAEAELDYVTIAGEYLFGETGFTSAFFAGLGVYRLEGQRIIGSRLGRPVLGDELSTTTVGLTGGFNGEFDVTKQLVIVAEIALHGLTQGEAQFFASGLVGVGFKF